MISALVQNDALLKKDRVLQQSIRLAVYCFKAAPQIVAHRWVSHNH